MNLLKLSFRFLKNHLKYTLLNVFGLAIGISAAYILFGYAYFHMSFDDFHPALDSKYRVLMHNQSSSGNVQHYASTFSPVGERLLADFPEVIDYVTVYERPSLISSIDFEKSFHEPRVCFASDSFFKIFSFEVIQGDRNADLKDIKTLLISERAAKKYFGDEDPINKVLYRNHDEEYIVKGVFKNPPANTHLQYDFIFSERAYAAIVEDNIYENWAWWDVYFAYIKTAPGTDIRVLENKLDDFMIKYRGDT
ncbi:MAG: ABC transporter permease, partial [Fulvivirga sp.]